MEDRPVDWSPPPPPPPTEPPPPPVLPWEDASRPWTTTLVETIKLLLTRPREAFERMPITGDLLRPFVFAILLGWIGVILNLVWSMAFKGMPHPSAEDPFSHLMAGPVTGVIVFFCGPFLVAFGVVFGAALTHLMLMILGGARHGFGATLRVECYARAADVLQFLPFCGGMLAAVGSLLLTIRGLATAHGISLGKATVAVLLPAVLCCGCTLVLAFTVFATFFSHYLKGMGAF